MLACFLISIAVARFWQLHLSTQNLVKDIITPISLENLIGKFKECRNFSYNSGKLITYRYTRGTNFSRRTLIEGEIILWLRRNKFETWRTYHLIQGGCLIQFPLIQVWLYLYTAILQLDINQAFMKALLAKVWQQTNIIIPPNNSEEHITKSFTKLELKLQNS